MIVLVVILKVATVRHVFGARRLTAALLALALSACSSGDGDGEGRSTQTTVSRTSLSFSADAPDAPAPSPQTVTVSFGDTVAHLAVIHSGDAIASITSTVDGRSAEITIEPASPSSLGSGIFQSTVAITGYFCADAACTSLAAGNTQRISVRYQISPVIQTVAPYVAVANVPGDVIIRGIGFASFATQGVRFGDVAGLEFTLVSDQEIRVTHPALPAGRYEVQLDIPTHEGTLQSEATLVVLEPVSYAAQALAYPVPVATVRELLYDAERSAVVLATDANGGALIRYVHGPNGWEAPTVTPLAEVQDIALATRGDHLLAITRDALVRFDPVTLAASTPIAAPSLEQDHFLRAIAVINDDRALITTGTDESTITPIYLYTGRLASLAQLSTALNNATPAATGQGSSVIFVQGTSSTTGNLAVVLFSTATGQFDVAPVALTQNAIAPAMDRTGTRAVLNGTNVYGPSFMLLGKLPESTAAVVLRSDGKRAYAYDTDAGGILVYDVSADREGEAYAALGPAVPLPANPGANPRMTISPDDNVLFIAGDAQLIVQPTPAL